MPDETKYHRVNQNVPYGNKLACPYTEDVLDETEHTFLSSSFLTHTRLGSITQNLVKP